MILSRLEEGDPNLFKATLLNTKGAEKCGVVSGANSGDINCFRDMCCQLCWTFSMKVLASCGPHGCFDFDYLCSLLMSGRQDSVAISQQTPLSFVSSFSDSRSSKWTYDPTVVLGWPMRPIPAAISKQTLLHSSSSHGISSYGSSQYGSLEQYMDHGQTDGSSGSSSLHGSSSKVNN